MERSRERKTRAEEDKNKSIWDRSRDSEKQKRGDWDGEERRPKQRPSKDPTRDHHRRHLEKLMEHPVVNVDMDCACFNIL